ncbi:MULTISPECIES: NUDIX hydrolase [unclassified Brevundimonas]|uniref:NUDIX hydrolase n=1 Tax=unclassified Brevundimonas TaxID=2622653 RepID=UPI0025C16842|nr:MULTISPECIES: NAD regulator [unclassified Brevundimonas]
MTDGDAHIPPHSETHIGVRIGLSAVIISLHQREAVVLTTHAPDGAPALPFGPFDPVKDRTFELALRDFVTQQTGFQLGFVEQLYTFGDIGRASPRASSGPQGAREVSVGYLTLTPDSSPSFTGQSGQDASWTPLFQIFPWEDWRKGPPASLPALTDGLRLWAGNDSRRLSRINTLFALSEDTRWNEERVLERYELLYEAGLVEESHRDNPRESGPAMLSDLPMASDHRRIAATGLGRLRSKLKYRPVLFDLMEDEFTLSNLQSAAEAVSGLSLHKQNFRRGVERTGLVTATGRFATDTGGRPAELFRYVGPDIGGASASGLTLPGQR